VNSQVPTTSLAELRQNGVSLGRFTTRSVGRTDVGRQRTANEDAMLIDEDLGLYLVCDGMGGHASGQVASELAVRTVAQALKSADQLADVGADPLVAALQAANRAVHERSQADPACHNMGTTAVAVRVEDDLLHVCHCGDSRLYLLRGGRLSQMTRDHSLVNLYKDKPELVGQMGPAASNVIVRAIGLEEKVEIDHRVVALEDGDVFLLCCDGLTDLVEDWMIREILTSGETLEVMSENLIRAANLNGGTDNITVVLIGFQSDETEDSVPVASALDEDAIEREIEAKEYPGTKPGF
jgi:serine/threonine protein phosphatase PrpC